MQQKLSDEVVVDAPEVLTPQMQIETVLTQFVSKSPKKSGKGSKGSPVAPDAPQKPPRVRKPKAKSTPAQLQDEGDLQPVNLSAALEAVADKDVSEPIEVNENAMDVDDYSVVDEFEQIPNEKQREMAYIARRALKEELLNQGQRLVEGFLGDEFNTDQKGKISQLVTRLYDEPKTFFQAIKYANKGGLKGAYKNLGKVKLLDSSKAIQKLKKDKIQGFRDFLTNKFR